MKTFFAALASVAVASYPKNNQVTFNIAASDAEPWSQEAIYSVVVLSETDAPYLHYQQTVNGGSDTWASNQCVLQWTMFKNWSNDASLHQYMFNYIRSDSTGGSKTHTVSCGETANTEATGISNNRSSTTSGCTDAWYNDSTGVQGAAIGASTSTVAGFRYLTTGNAGIDLAMGDSVTLQHGFSSYVTPASTVTPTHVTVGPEVSFVISDSAVALTLSAAAAAVAALAF